MDVPRRGARGRAGPGASPAPRACPAVRRPSPAPAAPSWPTTGRPPRRSGTSARSPRWCSVHPRTRASPSSWQAVSTPAQWDAQGEYYLARGHYAAAAECFRNAGNDRRLAFARAREAAHTGEHAQAAALFEAAGEPRQAAESWERAADWAGARRLWKALGERRRQRLCAARAHEEAGSWSKAAREWEEAGELSRAADCWEKAGSWERAARASVGAGELARAALLFEKARLPLEAAGCLEKAGRPGAAADLYAQAGDRARAARLYEAAGSEEKLLGCLREMGDERALGERLESRGRAREALAAYGRLAGRSPADRDALAASVPQAVDTPTALSAGLRLSALGEAQKAGRLLLRAGEFALAAEDFERAGLPDDAALCWEQTGQHLRAARALESGGFVGRETADRLHGLLHAHLTREAADPARAAEQLYGEALAMKADGRHVPALVRFRLLQDRENTLSLLRALAWHEEALRFLLDVGDTAAACAYRAAEGVTLPAPVAFRLVEDYAGQADPAALELFSLLLESSRGEGGEAAAALDRLVEGALANGVDVGDLPEGLLALLAKRRAAGAAMRVLRAGLSRGRAVSDRMRAFAAEVDRAARASGDPGLAQAAAWAAGRLAKARGTGGAHGGGKSVTLERD